MNIDQKYYRVAFELSATSRREGFGRGRVTFEPPDSDLQEDFWDQVFAETFETPATSRREGFGRHPDLQCGERQRTHKNFEARLYIKRKSVNVS